MQPQETTVTKAPPEHQLLSLFECYQNGRFVDAEKLAISITEEYPKHQLGWKILGAIFGGTDRHAEAVDANQAAVALFPEDAEAHSNLGNTFKELLRLDEAELSLRHAISLNRDFAEAHSNLGITLSALGRLDEAEAFLRHSILLKPTLAEAHNNLGLTLEGLGKLEDAHASYTQAVVLKSGFSEAHSNLGNALRQLLRMEDAEATLRHAIALNGDFAEAHTNLGLTLKDMGRLDEAEASLRQAITLKPTLAEGHNSLGILLQGIGRLEDAQASYTKAIAMRPNFAEAHNNLGNLFKELIMLEEAEGSFREAIALKYDFPEAYSNLGIVLKELGRLDEAEASYMQALVLKPGYALAHNNLGNTLKKLGRLDEAEGQLRQAIASNPDYAEAHCNLGGILQELGRLKEAEVSYSHALDLNSDYAEAMLNLSISLSYTNDLEGEIRTLNNLIQIDHGRFEFKARVSLAICNFLDGDFLETKKQIVIATSIQGIDLTCSRYEEAYLSYLSNIFKWYEAKNFEYHNPKVGETLYVIGESHSLVGHCLRVQRFGRDFFCNANLIKGCKQWHLGNPTKNKYKYKFESIFFSLPKSSEVLITIGEIDCRLDSGVIAHNRKFPEKDMEFIIATTIENYLTYIVNNNVIYQHNIIIQGVPCPNIDARNHTEENVEELIWVIKKFNFELKNRAIDKGFEFLDVHQFTDRGDGFSNAVWHIDSTHLSPEGFMEAWSRFVPS